MPANRQPQRTVAPTPEDTGADPARRFGNVVDDDAADSFPASDPPSHTPLTGQSFPSEETIRRAQERAQEDAEQTSARREG